LLIIPVLVTLSSVPLAVSASYAGAVSASVYRAINANWSISAKVIRKDVP
jgi:hypothetical protein